MMKRKVESVFTNEEPKKVRTERQNPSKVLHLRNLPEEITEVEVANVGVPFGMVTYLVVTKKNGQALIEMESVEVAEAMFEYYQQHSPHFRNKRCFVQYSVHDSLSCTESSMHPEAESAVAVANQIYDSMAKEPEGIVLRVMVDNWNHEKITSLHLYKIFQHYGTLEKIVVYVNKGMVQGFVQYADSFSAKVAKALTNGLCIFPRSCSMRVSFSNRKSLDISREDDMIRDFVKHPVTPQELKFVHINVGGGASKHGGEQRHSNESRHGSEPRHSSDIFRGSHDTMDALAALQPLLSQAVNHPEGAIPLLRTLAPAIREILNSSHDFRENSNHNFDRGMSSSHSNFGERISPLLIVSNLNEAKVNPDALFKLFGCYGDVTRVKIMYNRKNTALIQFVSDEHAQRGQLIHTAVNNVIVNFRVALQYLNGVNLYGKPIHANFSKHDRISHRAPNSISEEDVKGSECLHRDYTDHTLHRFRKKTSRNHVNVYEPSRVLHVAGLVDEATEEDVEAIFQDHKFRVKKIKIITPNNKKMALVEMSSVEVAVEALIALHDFDLCGSHLRVSFSKGLLT